MSNQQIPNNFRYSKELLSQYSIDALDNAHQLLHEATLLFENGRFARAHFLGISAIEETGKSFLAFDALGRNLKDSAVTAKIKGSLESHSRKINAAFHALIFTSNNYRSDIESIVELISLLKQGREPSMYTDINYINKKLYRPKDVVREVVARDCLRLANLCYEKTKEYQLHNKASIRSPNEDAFYGMKDRKLNELLETEDFWLYHIARLESGQNDIADSVIQYQRDYHSKNKKFDIDET
jgi:AbiV family abortive infection protein